MALHHSADDRLSALLAAIYEAGLDPRRWPETLAALAAALGGHAATLLAGRHGDPPLITAASGMAEEAILSYRAHYAVLDPVVPAVAAGLAGRGGPTTAWEVTRGRMDRTRFYAEWARPHGFEDYACAALLPPGAAHRAVLGIGRPPRAPHFGAAELDLFAGIVPHLRRAVEVHRRLAAVAALPGGPLAEALDHLATGAVLLDATGVMLWSNRAAQAMLRAADGLLLGRDGRLAAATAGVSALLRRLLAAALAGRAGGTLALPRPSGGPSLVALVLPLSERAAAERLGALPVVAWPRALLLLADPMSPGPEGAGGAEVMARRLGALYGLTPAEAAVAIRAARGAGLPEVAHGLGVAVTTARTHAQRAFHKAGVRGQAELARLVAGLAAIDPGEGEG